MSITLGRFSYVGAIREVIEPVVEIGNFSSVAGGVIFCGHVHHIAVKQRKCVTNAALHTFEPFKTLINTQGPDEEIFYCSIKDSWRPSGPGHPTEDGIIRVGNDAWIGFDALIFDGVTIGDGAVIGANAVITKDIPDYAVVVGNPSIIKKYRFPPEQIAALQKMKWWNWDDRTILERLPDLKDIDIFIEKWGIKN
jgi:acetyltransferase-like isoleucine patch superfamily enzyme